MGFVWDKVTVTEQGKLYGMYTCIGGSDGGLSGVSELRAWRPSALAAGANKASS